MANEARIMCLLTKYLYILICCFSCYRFLLVDFGLAQCVTTDLPMTGSHSEPTLRLQKRKREEVNINIGVSFNTFLLYLRLVIYWGFVQITISDQGQTVTCHDMGDLCRLFAIHFFAVKC